MAVVKPKAKPKAKAKSKPRKPKARVLKTKSVSESKRPTYAADPLARKFKLTDKQFSFCKQYIIDFNATRAAKDAGYSANTACATGSENLQKPDIQLCINHLQAKRNERTEVTSDRILKELAKLAFFNFQDIVDDKGEMLPLNKWKRDDMACLQEVTESITKIGGGEDIAEKAITKFKTYDKQKSLELLGKHHKLFTDKVEVAGENGGPIQNNWTVKPVTTKKE